MPEPNFVNRTVWTGDNLDVLRGINSECVDLIYLDPPFNSNRQYAAPIGSKAAGAAFKDTWTRDDVDDAEHGLLADQEPALYNVIAASRDAHGDSMFSYLIMMGTRLLEMRRVLKPTGSVYLHCDPTASHYLRTVMDAVFGDSRFRNEIIWKRTSSHSDAKRLGSVHDTLLTYAAGAQPTYNRQYRPYDPEYVRRRFRHQDRDGRKWMDDNLTAKGLQGGGYRYEYKGAHSLWRVSEDRMRQLDADNRLYFTRTGGIRIKRYLDEMKGLPLNDLWADIPPVNSQAKERLGYPTQKPVKLLERIISTSSNPGDMVLDPFCGCATTCVAAETLGREWAGIDLSPLAVTLVDRRLQDQHGVFGQIIARTDIPHRTDQGKPAPYRTHRHVLYGEQEGHCNGCRIHFPFRNLTVDHVVPRAKGGSDHRENLQLLCGACNSLKGTGTQAELLAKLKAQGVN